MCVCLYEFYVHHIHAGTHKGQSKLDLWEMELEIIVNHFI